MADVLAKASALHEQGAYSEVLTLIERELLPDPILQGYKRAHVGRARLALGEHREGALDLDFAELYQPGVRARDWLPCRRPAIPTVPTPRRPHTRDTRERERT